MDNAITILSDEKTRLENLRVYAAQRLHEVSSVATVQKTCKDQNGEERLVNYINLDMFTPEQKQQFELACSQYTEMRARLCVFDNYVKSMVPQSTIQSYNQYVPSLEEFKDVIIPCNNLEFDDNMNFTRSSIRVGSYNIESSREMTFEQYAQLYTSSLSKILLNSLGNNLSQEQAIQELAKSCSEIYLNPPQSTEELDSDMTK